METEVAPATVPYERDIARDLALRGLIAAPFAIAFGGLLRGWPGAVGVALGIGVVVFNYLVAGVLQSWAASKDSPGFLGGTVLVSLIFRFVVVVVALSLLRDSTFCDFGAFAISLVVSHLGLLAWEAKSVRLTLAFPGLKRDLKSNIHARLHSDTATGLTSPSNALGGKD